jgi:hypothetical protein
MLVETRIADQCPAFPEGLAEKAHVLNDATKTFLTFAVHVNPSKKEARQSRTSVKERVEWDQ